MAGSRRNQVSEVHHPDAQGVVADAVQSDRQRRADEQQRAVRALIRVARDQGFVTHAQINDHLPDDVAQPTVLEDISRTFLEMGVTVYEQVPDTETLLLDDALPAVTLDDQTEEDAEVALSTVDAEYGRTTDPVRMYMRTGSVRSNC